MNVTLEDLDLRCHGIAKVQLFPIQKHAAAKTVNLELLPSDGCIPRRGEAKQQSSVESFWIGISFFGAEQGPQVNVEAVGDRFNQTGPAHLLRIEFLFGEKGNIPLGEG